MTNFLFAHATRHAHGCLHSVDRELTKTELARREKLEKQPLAMVIDHMNVGCKRCGGLVKLTKHHLYDYSHWKTHRERCDKWSQAELNARLEKSTLVSPAIPSPRREDGTHMTLKVGSRLSTPSLVLDAGSDLTDLSSDSELETSPPTEEERHALSEARPSERSPSRESFHPVPGPLSSHLACAEYMAVAHPGAKTIDLNAPLEDIPEWSFAQLKLPAFLDPVQAEAESKRCVLSAVNWADAEYEDDESDGEDDWVAPTPPLPRAPVTDSTTPDATTSNA